MTGAEPAGATPQEGDAERLIAALREREATLAVAESLTGGLLSARIVDVPGASTVLRGGVVSYATEVKHTVLGVDADLLAERGAVDPDVAIAMAEGVRRVCAVGGAATTYGLSTTGVAGPDPQDGHPVGTVFLGLSGPGGSRAVALRLDGDRASIRRETVDRAVAELLLVVAVSS